MANVIGTFGLKNVKNTKVLEDLKTQLMVFDFVSQIKIDKKSGILTCDFSPVVDSKNTLTFTSKIADEILSMLVGAMQNQIDLTYSAVDKKERENSWISISKKLLKINGQLIDKFGKYKNSTKAKHVFGFLCRNGKFLHFDASSLTNEPVEISDWKDV